MGDRWTRMTLEDAIEINPSRTISRGAVAPHISMELLQPVTREIRDFEMKEFKGSGSRFQNDDTLLARITPCLENGKIAFVSCLPDGAVGHGSTEFIVLSGKEGISDTLFVYYLARDPDFRNYAIQYMEGSTGRQRVPASAIVRLTIDLPPLPEQKAIASILGALDDKIELNRKMNETLEAMAQAIFKSWFMNFDPIPGLDPHKEWQDSPLGRIPKGWRVLTLGDIAELYRNTINPLNFPDEVFEHFSIPAFDERQMPTHDLGSSIKSNKFILPDHCVLVSKLNPRFPRVWFLNCSRQRRAVASTEFLVLVAKPPCNNEFLFSLCKLATFHDTFLSLVTGTSSSHQRVKPDDLMSMKTICPPDDILSEFAQKISSLFNRIHSHKKQSLTLAAIRDALLPNLLSGEVSVRQIVKSAVLEKKHD